MWSKTISQPWWKLCPLDSQGGGHYTISTLLSYTLKIHCHMYSPDLSIWIRKIMEPSSGVQWMLLWIIICASLFDVSWNLASCYKSRCKTLWQSWILRESTVPWREHLWRNFRAFRQRRIHLRGKAAYTGKKHSRSSISLTEILNTLLPFFRIQSSSNQCYPFNRRHSARLRIQFTL